ncbi:hypothetical protein KAFR_0E04060 [Kazachstania africana CBS 2517]|uniref:Mitochondrial translation factor ATP22 n=1 Tax=Kazachstania africana (strain ATCC 22294 / BCRC 22015 / CBS 2517 / CECT 1963 / NBRC 1671 / NRRL Y-8276) TaxID=1071382 RepID=H2AW07_KAZAF|nr:hypothetical protein KAFR_0E04060 [Kazachstania africana CBS 2517]CCF58557.1 hypothetical protein KAFR_0E04060 [Kazachstania africana CBS 2517]
MLRYASSWTRCKGISRCRWITQVSKTKDRDTIENIVQTSTFNALCDSTNPEIKHLVDSIESSTDYTIIPRLKLQLKKLYPQKYTKITQNLIDSSNSRSFMQMVMYQYVGSKQYESFLSNLRAILSDSRLSDSSKGGKVYEIIKCQRTVFPIVNPPRPLVLPDDVHRWFYEHLSSNEFFKHYYFLISHDVHLSSSKYIKRMTSKLLQGSELERQLATFEYFSKFENSSMFKNKFLKLHDFKAMIHLMNNVIKHNRNSKYIEIFLVEMIKKIEEISLRNKYNDVHKITTFITFLNELLFIISEIGNLQLFSSVFKILIEFIEFNKELVPKGRLYRFLHVSIHSFFKLLRKQNNNRNYQDAVFTLISVTNNLSVVPKTWNFKKRIVQEIMSSLKYFEDPKIMCLFMISAIKKPDPLPLLNDLGIYGFVFHNDIKHISTSNELLDRKSEQLNNKLLPQSLAVELDNISAILTELYIVLLSTSCTILKASNFENVLVRFYKNYIKYLEANSKKFYLWKHDTGIMNVFIDAALFKLNNFQMAYNFLIDFYSKPCSKRVKITSKNCPFSTIIYSNRFTLTDLQLSELFTLMERNNIPLSFKICTAMLLRNNEKNQIQDAHSWYKKILAANFEIKHFQLIQLIKKHKWELPVGFDLNLFDTLDSVSSQKFVLDKEDDSLILDDVITNNDDVHITNLMKMIQNIG